MAGVMSKSQDEASQMVDYIMNHIQDENSKPLRLCINGAAGSGKTHIVKLLKKRLTDAQILFLLLASTNSAAQLIGGDTVFKKLRFDGKELWKPSTARKEYFKDFKIVIIDEAFLLQCAALDRTNETIKMLKSNPDAFFGNVHVIFVGDFFQLPAPEGSPAHLWDDWQGNEFVFRTLTSNKRQENDGEFRKRLDRWAKGNVVQEDINFLKEKQVCGRDGDIFSITAEYFLNSKWDKKTSMILTTSGQQALKFSEHLLRAQNITVYEKMPLLLINTQPVKKEEKPTMSPLENGNEIFIGINVPVVFTKDAISVDRQPLTVAKGTVGIIKEITKKGENVMYLRMKFGTGSQLYTFNREQQVIPRITGCPQLIHFTFNLRALYVSVVHSVQGQTLTNIIIDTTDSYFGPAVFYTAASRLQSQEGLKLTYLGNITMDEIKCIIHADPNVLSKMRLLDEAITQVTLDFDKQ